MIVPRSAGFADATIEGVVAIGPGLHTREGWRPALSPGAAVDGSVRVDDLQAWCAEMDLASQFH